MEAERCLMVITGALFLDGGIATANRLALFAFLDAGYAVDVIAFNEMSDVSTDCSDRLTYKGIENKKGIFTFKAWQAILSKRYDVIFCDHVNLAILLAPLGIMHICRYIVRLNGIEVFPDGINWEGKIGLRSTPRRLAISEHTRQQVLKQYPNMNVEICDLSLGPDRSLPPLRSDVQRNVNISLTAVDGADYELNGHVILHVGRMASAEQYKGQDILIQTLHEVINKVPDAQLVLVGRGDDTERLRRMVLSQPAEIQRATFLTGFVSDELLEQLYDACYMFAMPSRGEGFGLVYLEAMRYAKPCLGSKIDAARCIIRDGETGVLISDPTDLSEVVEGLLQVLQQPDLARKMGVAGFDLLNQYYLFQHFRERFIDFVRRPN